MFGEILEEKCNDFFFFREILEILYLILFTKMEIKNIN